MESRRTPTAPILALAAALLLGGCAAPTATPTAWDGPPPTAAPSGADDVRTETAWNLAVVSAEAAADLKGTRAYTQYDGTTSETPIEQKPASGSTFLLLELVVEKKQAGAPAFSWKDVRVEDGAGGSWSRMANDTFLESFGFPRVKSTDLTFGRNEGFVCFEIPESAAKGALHLVHEGSDGRTRLWLRLGAG